MLGENMTAWMAGHAVPYPFPLGNDLQSNATQGPLQQYDGGDPKTKYGAQRRLQLARKLAKCNCERGIHQAFAKPNLLPVPKTANWTGFCPPEDGHVGFSLLFRCSR